LQDRIALDGGTLRLENADLFFDGVDVEVQEPRRARDRLDRSYATQRRTLDLAFRACDDRLRAASSGSRTKRGSVPAPVLQAPLALDAPAHPLAAAGAMVVRGVRCSIVQNGGAAGGRAPVASRPR
jgi:hypothetical protein